MKAMNHFAFRPKWVAVALAGAVSLAAGAMARTAQFDPVTGYEAISGVVTAVTADGLIVNDRESVAITPATACTQDGQTALLADLGVGDRVRVELCRDSATGREQAILVDVLEQPGVGG